jgi:diguanylate cyclase (GGDEF)-like protein/PAS domain S-box-containing protein
MSAIRDAMGRLAGAARLVTLPFALFVAAVAALAALLVLEDQELVLAALTLLLAAGRAGRAATAARRLQLEIGTSRTQLAEAQALAHAGSFEFDLATGAAGCSDELWRIIGIEAGSAALTPELAYSLIHQDDRAEIRAQVRRNGDGAPFECRCRITRPTGEIRYIEARGRRSGTRLQASIQDVTVRRAGEERVRRSEARHRLVVESAQDGIWLLDDDRRTIFLNRRMGEILGRPPQDVLGRDPIEFTDAAGQELITQARDARGADEAGQYEARFVQPDGTIVSTVVSVSPLRDEHSNGFVIVVTDMTERMLLEAGLRRAADEDALTGLASRSRFESAIAERAALGGGFAIAMIDIDHIKFVNDSYGHSAGDELLCHAARAMKGALRETDLLARFGGDEFGILLATADEDSAIAAANRVLQTLRDDRWRGLSRQTASAGVAIACSKAPANPADLLKAADLALYEAKTAGRDRCVLYRGHDAGLAWVDEVRAAIDEERLTLFSQRLFPLGAGAEREELLVRMLDANGEILPPSAFIPTAEQFGLIADLDLWVVGRAIELARRGRSVEVNISGASLGEHAITDLVADAVADGLDPSLMVFEITETAAVRNLAEARLFAQSLTGLGCGVALDDFGTGYGSLTYLRHLPVTQIKIDIDFVRDLATDAEARRMVKAIVGMAKTLGKETVAEGVEDLAVIPILREIGVDFAQGYALHRPEPVDAALAARSPRHPRA